MGLFEAIFGKKKEPQSQVFTDWKTLTAYKPIFTNWCGEIYESELVRSAINIRALHISKLKFEIAGAAQPSLQTKLKHAPNEFQTWSQFFYRLSTILDVQNTAFIVPVINDLGQTTGIFSVLPSRCEIKKYKDVPYLRYEFMNGEHAAIELSRCGIMTKYQYSSDFFGETNRAMRKTMELIDIQNQGITEGVKSAATYRFMAQIDNFTKVSDLVKEQRRFSEENFGREVGGGGLLLLPNTYKNVQQINSKPFVVDAEQMRIIQGNVYNYFNVNESILQSSASDTEMDTFYNTCVETFAIQFSDVCTKMLFSPIEQSYGAAAYAASNRLQYMSVPHKVQLAKELADRGAIMIDEIRELFNFAPLPDGAGQMAPIRGEYYNANTPDNEEEGDDTDASET